MKNINLRDPSMQLPISGQGNSKVVAHKTKVANLVGRMLGKQKVSATFENSLETHLAVSAGSQEAAGTDLAKLAKDIEAGKNQISIGTKFLTRIKSMFGGKSYDVAIAKQAFSKIENAETKRTLLELAFQAAALSKEPVAGIQSNVEDNAKILLKLCQAAGVKADDIIKSINTIPDSDGKVQVLKGLSSAPDFKLDNLSSAVARELILGLAKAGPDGVDCLRRLQTKLPQFQGADAKQLVLNLPDAGTEGADCLEQLIESGKMDLTGADATQLVLNLAGQPKGADCLLQLFRGGRLQNLNLQNFTDNEAKRLVQDLANKPKSPFVLQILLEKSYLNNPSVAKELAIGLANSQYGALRLHGLLQNKKLTNLNLSSADAKQLVLNLPDAGTEGADCLRTLANMDKLQNLKLRGINTPEGVKAKVLELLKQGRSNLTGLKNLLEENLA